MEEIFKIIPWYDGKYSVSNMWVVIRNNTWKPFSFTKNKKKNWKCYLWVTLCNWWKEKYHLVHRLVAQNFIDNPMNKPCVNHLDWNPSNNVISNLEWCTFSENEKYSFDVLGKVVWNKWKKLSEDHIRKAVINRNKTHKKNCIELFEEFKKSWLSIYEFEKLKWKSRTCYQKRFIYNNLM